MNHHTSDELCPLCEEKLQGAHPTMVAFYRWARIKHPETHIAWAFRDKEDQDHMFQMHLTKAQWPHGKHNRTDSNGNPKAEALDLFQIVDGHAVFDNKFYETLNSELVSANMPIEWAGSWKSFKEEDHFQTKETV